MAASCISALPCSATVCLYLRSVNAGVTVWTRLDNKISLSKRVAAFATHRYALALYLSTTQQCLACRSRTRAPAPLYRGNRISFTPAAHRRVFIGMRGDAGAPPRRMLAYISCAALFGSIYAYVSQSISHHHQRHKALMAASGKHGKSRRGARHEK